MGKTKIAIYSGTIPSTTFIENLIKAIASEGMVVLLFGSKTGSVSYKYANIRQFPTPDNPMLRLVFTAFELIYTFIINPKRLFRLLRNRDRSVGFRKQVKWLSKTLPVINHLPDIFHVQWAKSASEWIFLKELFGVKMVMSLRGAHINYSPICDPVLAEVYKNIFPQFEAFHAVSKAIGKEAEKYGANSSKIKVIYSGVDLKVINRIVSELQTDQGYSNKRIKKPDNQRSIGNKGTQPINIVSVGRFHWKKGYLYAIDACEVLKERGINFKYTIIATGDGQKYMYQINDLGLNEFIEIIPGMSHEDTLRKIATSDILLLPSIEEGIANVVYEALSLGTYVISTDCGGMKEIINDSTNAKLIEKYNSMEIANAIIGFQSLPQHIRNLNKDNGGRVYDLKTTGTEMIKLYAQIQ